MFMEQLIAQIIGFIALIILVVSFQFDNRKTILNLRSLHNFANAAHFYLLNAPTAAILNLISIFRNSVFLYRFKNKYLNNIVWLILFLVVFILVGFFTWEGLVSILAIIGIGFGTLGVWSEKTKDIRYLTLLSNISWLIHNILVVSIAGIILNIFIIVSIIIAMIRFDVESKLDSE